MRYETFDIQLNVLMDEQQRLIDAYNRELQETIDLAENLGLPTDLKMMQRELMTIVAESIALEIALTAVTFGLMPQEFPDIPEVYPTIEELGGPEIPKGIISQEEEYDWFYNQVLARDTSEIFNKEFNPWQIEVIPPEKIIDDLAKASKRQQDVT